MEKDTRQAKSRRTYTKPEVKHLGKLNEIIRGSGSCGKNDAGSEKNYVICGQ